MSEAMSMIWNTVDSMNPSKMKEHCREALFRQFFKKLYEAYGKDGRQTDQSYDGHFVLPNLTEEELCWLKEAAEGRF